MRMRTKNVNRTENLKPRKTERQSSGKKDLTEKESENSGTMQADSIRYSADASVKEPEKFSGEVQRNRNGFIQAEDVFGKESDREKQESIHE